MAHGHNPRDIDEYNVRDVWMFMDMFPVIQMMKSPFGGLGAGDDDES